ncbi:MAG: hypothetical protein R6U98_02070, partial [Pirellulaceae bacterium]
LARYSIFPPCSLWLVFPCLPRQWTEDGFFENRTRKGGQRLNITVSGLPAGRHEVYLRYLKMPRAEGDNWWYTFNSPVRPHANLFLTQPGTAHRMLMGFLAFAAKTDGFLYYAAHGGRVNGANANVTSGPYTNISTVFTDRDFIGPANVRLSI